MITLDALHGLFTRRELTPREHLDRVLSALRDAAARTPAHAAVRDYNDDQARRAADAATARYASGQALGDFDGGGEVGQDDPMRAKTGRWQLACLALVVSGCGLGSSVVGGPVDAGVDVGVVIDVVSDRGTRMRPICRYTGRASNCIQGT